MKKTLIYSGLVLLASVLWGCNKEKATPSDPGETPEEVEIEDVFSLKATSDAISRTELGVDRYIYWKETDDLSVWEDGYAGNANVKLTLDAESAGEKTGTFTGSLTPSTASFKLLAMYPYSSAYGSDPSNIAVSLPVSVEQKDDVNDVVGVSDFMVGSGSFTEDDSEYLMRFRYPLTLLDIVVDGTGSCLSGATVESVTITANVPFVGDGTMDLTTGTLTPADDEAGKSLVVTFPSTATMDVARHAWVAVYPVDLTNAGCCFDLKMTNGQEIKFNVNPKKVFEEQKIYTISLTDIDTHVDAGEATPIYFDLVGASGGARANCYIVSEGGYYRFAAQKVVKVAGSYENVFEGSQPYTDGYRADWLWSEGSESLVGKIGVGNSGNIMFRVKAGARGNAVIALFDPTPKVVWSWHIWMTEADALNPTHYSRNSAWGLAARNLGALSSDEGDVDSYGLYYQWGRKDPFPATNTVGQNSASKETNPFNQKTKAFVVNTSRSVTFSSVRNSVAGATDEIAYTIEHPTTFIHYYTNNSTHGLTNTWFYKTPVADAQLLWNSTTTKANKTNYDPCPPGWTVPVNNSYAWNTGGAYDYVFFNYVAPETNENLSGLVYSAASENRAYYPAAGYRQSGQLTNVGYVGYYWSATTNTTTAFTAYGLQYEARGTKQSAGQKLQSAFALPVRCLKI